MATELGKAYVQIIPSAKGIGSSISSELNGESAKAGESAGLNLVGKLKGVIAAAGIGAAIKSSLEAGGDLQQSFGGLDTLYGDAADAAKAYAAEAAKAGISANDYAEQAVSFGASLKQAFEGDTTKAVEAANTAIMDMADNAAKMGTPIENIQNAYQGFAKQNYTMLDNLKLGYGGTKSEMERLLADAQELSGVEYNLDNLGDVYEAIHVIQEDLGLTGVAAQEGAETFTGSLAAMKAAGQNLLANLALGQDIGPSLNALSETVQAFVFNNLFPMIGNILQQLPQLLSGLSSIIIGALNRISNNADQIVSIAIELVTSLANAIVEALPYLAEAAIKIAMALGRALIETDWVSVGKDLLGSLRDSLDLASGEIFGSDDNILQAILNSITSNLPAMASKGVEIISSLANGIFEAYPQIVSMASEIVTTLGQFIIDNAPTLLSAGVDLILNLVNGFLDNLPAMIDAAAQMIANLLAFLLSNAPKLIVTGIELIAKLAIGLIQAIPKIVAAIPQIIQSIIDAFSKFDWPSIGKNILEGIKNGILGAISAVVDAAKEAASAVWDAVKGFFEIGSPSKLMAYAGEMIDEGLAGGITDNQGLVDNAITSLSDSATSSLEISPSYGSFATEQDDRVDQLISLLNNYLPAIASGENMNLSLEGDAAGLFNLVRRENKVYKRMNGESAFA